MPDPEITTREEDGQIVHDIFPASAIIGALEIEEADEQADDESKK